LSSSEISNILHYPINSTRTKALFLSLSQAYSPSSKLKHAVAVSN
jgi:hypothetical protein